MKLIVLRVMTSSGRSEFRLCVELFAEKALNRNSCTRRLAQLSALR